MLIGVDFDNTIVSYDTLFQRVAREWDLVPANIPASKTAVRDHLRAIGREDQWTELQGHVYGSRMAEAEPFAGVLDFFRQCRRSGIATRIISHKTRQPFLGAKHDLHAAAHAWLESQGFFSPDGVGLDRSDVYFELTKQAKIERIAACGCQVFVDDLPEFLTEPAFPPDVAKLLFDPTGRHACPRGVTCCRDWLAIFEQLLALAGHTDDDAIEERLAAGLVELAPRLPFPLTGTPQQLAGGANNRTYSLRGPDGRRLLLKAYYAKPGDTRDRFATEQRFYCYAWNTAGERSLPEPIAWDKKHRLGVFEYVDDCRPLPGEIGPAEVDSALQFISTLNASRHTPAARQLPAGAEACFTTEEHLAVVQRRVARLESLPETGENDNARQFIREELAPSWQEIRTLAELPLSDGGAGTGVVPADERCLSPSDFGFHNALRRFNGTLVFFDFEYAGWDDPAKLVCDFFCQPAVPVPATHFEPFVRRLAAALQRPSAGELLARCRALLPVYRLKWCCIMLNDFLPIDSRRRSFACGDADREARRNAQLAKARAQLASLNAPPCHLVPVG